MPQYQGIWTLAQAAQLQSTQQWATDPLLDYTTLLLQADNAANGAQNNTFLDSSSNNFTITRNGNTTQGTFTPYSLQPGAWGNYFGGSQSINAPASTDFQFAGDFTIEGWVYTTLTSDTSLFVQQSSTNYFALNVQPGTNINVYLNNPSANFTVTDRVPATNTWNHIALVRSGSGSGNVKLYLNGIASSTTVTNTSTVGYNALFYVGALGTQSAGSWNGYISNVRVVNGTALYTSNFTPSPLPLTAVTNTKLLTCQSNQFVDTNTQVSAKTLTVNGTPSVQAFSPFAPQYQYTPSVTGGSGYFDGTGDYLVAPSNAALAMGTGDFQIEFWAYHTSIPASFTYIDTRPTGTNGSYITLGYNNSGDGIFLYVNGMLISTGLTPVANAWTHFVLSRVGSTTRLFRNGSQIGSASDGTNYAIGAQGMGIGGNTISAGNYFFGYMAGFRVVKGSGVTSVTVPTAPLTAITNTSLLLNFTNAGIYDGTLKNDLETVGNAQVSTSVVKYGTGSMYFDGSGDWLLFPLTENLKIPASSPFTIEGWFYLTAAQANYRMILSDSSATTTYIAINSTGLEAQFGGVAGTLASITQTFNQNTWYHIAVVRNSSNVVSIYIDGVAKTVTNSTQSAAFLSGGTVLYVGKFQGATNYEWNGYIDDLRITKGIARYTANFTPPRVALPRQ